MNVQICVGKLLGDVELYVGLTVDLELIGEKEVAVDFMNEDFEEDVSKSSGCSHTNSSTWLFFLSIFLLLTRRE